MSGSNCCFLTCIQVSQKTCRVVWYSHLSKNFPVCCDAHSQDFSTVNETEVDFFWNSLVFCSVNVGNLISGYSACSQSSLYIWKFSVHVLLKVSLKDFASMWNECNCAVTGILFGIPLFWDWNENWLFSVLWPLLCFPNLLAHWGQHFHSIIF